MWPDASQILFPLHICHLFTCYLFCYQPASQHGRAIGFKQKVTRQHFQNVVSFPSLFPFQAFMCILATCSGSLGRRFSVMLVSGGHHNSTTEGGFYDRTVLSQFWSLEVELPTGLRSLWRLRESLPLPGRQSSVLIDWPLYPSNLCLCHRASHGLLPCVPLNTNPLLW